MNRPAGQKELQKMHTHRFSQLLINLVLIFSLALAGLLVRTERVQALSADIVISQVYGGGGNSGATYTHDFVELFNRGTSSVSSMAGQSNMPAPRERATLVRTLSPYFPVHLHQGSTTWYDSQEASNGVALPTPDVTGFHPGEYECISWKGCTCNFNNRFIL
jgi:uncharacterized protein